MRKKSYIVKGLNPVLFRTTHTGNYYAHYARSLFARLMLRKLTALCFRSFGGCTLKYTLW